MKAHVSVQSDKYYDSPYSKNGFHSLFIVKETATFKFLTFVRIILYAGSFICNKILP